MRSISLLLIGLVLFGCARAEFTDNQKIIAAEIEKLSKAEGTIEILSLDPSSRHGYTVNTRKVFHGFGILGSAEAIDAKEKSKLLSALAKAIIENDGLAAACFEPRHGLRFVSSGKAIDIVICFHCASAHCYGINDNKGVLLTASAEPVFNEFLKWNKVPLAKKSE